VNPLYARAYLFNPSEENDEHIIRKATICIPKSATSWTHALESATKGPTQI